MEPLLDSTNKTTLSRMVLSFYAINLFDYMTIYGIVTIFPRYALQKGITESQIGIIISFETLMQSLSIVVVGKYISLIGRKKILLLSQAFLISGTLIFGYIMYFDYNFYLMTLVARSFQGIGVGMSNTIMNAYLPTFFPNTFSDIQKNLLNLQAIGCLIGPTFFSVFYMIGGYKLPFQIIAVINFMLIIYLNRILPTDKTYESETFDFKIMDMLDINLIKQSSLIFTVAFVFYYMEPYISLYLIEIGYPNQLLIGVFYQLPCITYIFMQQNIHHLQKCFQDQTIQIFGLITAIAMILLSGGLVFGPKVIQFAIGISMGGVATGTLQNITMKCIFDSIQSQNTHIHKDIVIDIGSTLINGSYSFAQFIGPLVFGFLYQHYGFAMANVYSAVLVSSIFLFFIAHKLMPHKSSSNAIKV